mgnify:CR=1 FL=1
MQNAKHLKSKNVTVVKADGLIETINGTFAVSGNEITGLPTGNKIVVGDRIEYTYTSSATLLENGLVGAGDASGLEPGTGILRIDKAQSNFASIGAVQAAFTAGLLISFQNDVLAGGTVEVKASPGMSGFTAIDGIAFGDPGYWCVAIDLTTATGFPSLATFAPPITGADYTTLASIPIYQGVAGPVTLSDLIVGSITSPTSVSIEQTIDNVASFTDVQVTKHSRFQGPLISEQIEASSLKVGGESISSSITSVPYSGTVSSLKLIWKGKDNIDNVIANDTPHLPEITPTDVFNVNTDIDIIQLLNHPSHKDIVVMLYQNLIDSFYYVKCFKYTYEDGFDDSYTPFLISGADSNEIRIQFSTFIDGSNRYIVESPAPHDPLLFIIGGKSSPGNSIYAAVTRVDPNTLTISDSGLFSWGDIGVTTANSIGYPLKVVDLQPIKTSPNANRRLVIVYDASLAFIIYNTTSNTFTLSWDHSGNSSTICNYDFEYHGNNDIFVNVVKANSMIRVDGVGPQTEYDISENNFSKFKKLYFGTSKGELTLYKIDRYKGIGAESIELEDSFSGLNRKRSKNNYEVLPANFQNTSGKSQNVVMEIGGDKLLFYKSFGYYVLLNKENGKLLYLDRIGSNTIDKDDYRFTISVNDHTVLLYTGTAWKAIKFLTDGPYLAFGKDGNNALIAPNGSKVTTSFGLTKGLTYYSSWIDNQIKIIPLYGTIPGFAAKKIGVAIDTNSFIVDMDLSPTAGAIEFPSTLQKDVTTIIDGLGTGRLLFENASGKISQSTNIKVDSTFAKLGVVVGLNDPEFYIQTLGNIASGPLYDPALSVGTSHDVVNGGANGLSISGTGDRIITGFQNPFTLTTGSALFLVINSSATYKLILKHQNVGSSALNRISTPDQVDYVITPLGWVILHVNEGGWSVVTRPEEKIPLTVTSSVTVDLGIKDKFNVTVNGAPITLALTNPIQGKTYKFVITQGATPDNFLFSGGTIIWEGGVAYTANATPNSVDSITLYYDGTNYLGTFGINYA